MAKGYVGLGGSVVNTPQGASYHNWIPTPTGKPPSPIRNTWLTFQGIGFSSGVRRSIDVMCGASPPTITAGYANWQTVARPLQRGLTVIEGYDPTTMTVDIIFGDWIDGWKTGDDTGQKVEDAIGTLEWMGGANFVAGPSPVIYAFSYATYGGQNPLIPRQYQSLPWIISGGVQWGTAYRNKNGYRVWQEATFTLEHYLNLGAPPQADTTKSGGYFTTRPGMDTALKIAGSPSVNSPTVDHRTLAENIMTDTKNNPVKDTSIRLGRKSISWQMRKGLQIWVPGHTVD